MNECEGDLSLRSVRKWARGGLGDAEKDGINAERMCSSVLAL